MFLFSMQRNMQIYFNAFISQCLLKSWYKMHKYIRIYKTGSQWPPRVRGKDSVKSLEFTAVSGWGGWSGAGSLKSLCWKAEICTGSWRVSWTPLDGIQDEGNGWTSLKKRGRSVLLCYSFIIFRQEATRRWIFFICGCGIAKPFQLSFSYSNCHNQSIITIHLVWDLHFTRWVTWALRGSVSHLKCGQGTTGWFVGKSKWQHMQRDSQKICI